MQRLRLQTLPVRRQLDVAIARHRTRVAAEAVAIAPEAGSTVVAAIAEIACTLVERGWAAHLALDVLFAEAPVGAGWSPIGAGGEAGWSAPAALSTPAVGPAIARALTESGVVLALTFRTPVRPDDGELLDLRVRLGAARDAFDVRERGAATELTLAAPAPPWPSARARAARARELLAAADAADSTEAVRGQNRELLSLLDELRLREREVERMNHELRRAHEIATVAVAQLAQLARRKDELSATIAHDLRSPLAAVKGAIDLLAGGAGGGLSHEQLHYVEIAERSAHRVLDLVNDLLDSSLLDAGLVRLEVGEIDVRALIDDVSATHGFLAHEKGIAYRIDAPPELPPVVADRRKLGQILGNLLSNAVKFTDAGGSVSVAARIDEGWLKLTVADTGIGLPSARPEDVFEKHGRPPCRGTRGERGTGLGLTICKQLVDLHGGRIHVESQPGAGTTFRVELPARPTTLAVDGAATAGEVV